MATGEQRTARDFSRKEIAELAISYARTEEEVARNSFRRGYDISESTFYSLLHKAVMEGIVSDSIVEAMREKSSANAYANAGTKGRKQSRRKYNYLIARRATFVFPKSVRRKIAIDYVASILPKDEYCRTECITKSLFDRTIKSAIVDGLISDKYVNLLEGKACRLNGEEKTKPVFQKLRNERTENRRRRTLSN